MSRALIQCVGCKRHIRVFETQCPFCGESRRVDEAKPIGTLAALMGATLALAGCGQQSSNTAVEPTMQSAANPAVQTPQTTQPLANTVAVAPVQTPAQQLAVVTPVVAQPATPATNPGPEAQPRPRPRPRYGRPIPSPDPRPRPRYGMVPSVGPEGLK